MAGAGNATIGALRVNLGIDSAEFSDGLKQAEDRLFKFKAVAAGALAVVAGAAASAAVGLSVAIKGVIDNADEMSKAAQKFGVPIEQLTALKYAADLSDVSLQSLGTGLSKLARAMDDAATGGTSKAAEAFANLGIQVENSDGTLRSQSEVLAEVANRFANMSDGAQKTALAVQIFGKSGAELIPLLNGGAEGLRSMAAEADSLGLVIDQKTGTAAENFNDNLTRLTKVSEGLLTKLAAGLAPTLERLSDIFVDLARDEAQVDAAIEGLADLFDRVAKLAYSATIDVRNFVAETRALYEVASAPNWEGMKDAWQGYQTVLAENEQRTKDSRDRMRAMWLPDASEGLGSDYQNGQKPEDGGYDQASDREQNELDRMRERAERKLEFLRQSLMTEEEAENASYLKRLEQIQEFEDQRLISSQEAADLRYRTDKDYYDKLAVMEEQRLNDFASTLGSAGSIIQSLTQIMGKEGDKQLGIVKALSLAEALINVYTGITAALRLPFPANMAAAAQVAAQGFAAVAAIKGTNKGGGSGGGAGGGSSAGAAAPAAAAPADNRTLFVSGISPGQLYSGDNMRALMEALVGAQKDGYKLVLGAA